MLPPRHLSQPWPTLKICSLCSSTQAARSVRGTWLGWIFETRAYGNTQDCDYDPKDTTSSDRTCLAKDHSPVQWNVNKNLGPSEHWGAQDPFQRLEPAFPSHNYLVLLPQGRPNIACLVPPEKIRQVHFQPWSDVWFVDLRTPIISAHKPWGQHFSNSRSISSHMQKKTGRVVRETAKHHENLLINSQVFVWVLENCHSRENPTEAPEKSIRSKGFAIGKH